MKLTWLDLVQDILNDIDSDEVNSIDDTIEAQQVAQIVKSTYFAMMSNRNWPHLKKPVQLNPPTVLAQPTHMTLVDDVKEMVFINYDISRDDNPSKHYTRLIWLEPDDFLRVLNNRSSNSPTVSTVIDDSGIELLITNNQPPSYYTSFDDNTVVFDSYDSEVESTLQRNKVQAQAYVMPEWVSSEDEYPDLPSEAFTALLEEAKSRASLKLRQAADSKAEQESQRQQRWLSRKAFKVKGGVNYPNYGRGRARAKDVTFKVNK